MVYGNQFKVVLDMFMISMPVIDELCCSLVQRAQTLKPVPLALFFGDFREILGSLLVGRVIS